MILIINKKGCPEGNPLKHKESEPNINCNLERICQKTIEQQKSWMFYILSFQLPTRMYRQATCEYRWL